MKMRQTRQHKRVKLVYTTGLHVCRYYSKIRAMYSKYLSYKINSLAFTEGRMDISVECPVNLVAYQLA